MRQGGSRKSGRRIISRGRWFSWGVGLLTLFSALGATYLARQEIEPLTHLVFDAYQRVLPRPAGETSVAIVDIDEDSIKKLGQWPWSRSTLAAIVRHLSEMNVAAIGFDIVFSEPDRFSLQRAIGDLQARGVTVSLPADFTTPDSDEDLAGAFRSGNVVTGIAISSENNAALPKPKAGFSFGGADPKTYLPGFSGGVVNIPGLTEAATGMGFFSFPPSRDNVVRTIPLITSAQGSLYPALSIETLRLAQGAGSFIVRSNDASGEIGGNAGAMTVLKDGDFSIPTGPAGEFWVYFSGLPHAPVVSAADLLSPDAVQKFQASLEGRIVLVGTSAVGLRDLVATPIAEAMPGVRVHAEVIDQIVSRVFLTRPDWVQGAQTFTAVVLGLIMIALAARAGAVFSTASFVVLLGGAGVISWFGFANLHILIDPLLPAITLLAVFLVMTPLRLALANRDKLFVRQAFARYLSPTLIERLAEDSSRLELGGELRELTVLFSDIRGFTSLSENLDPQQLTGMLNSYLTPMTDILLNRQGTIDKYIGDAIMAFWNAPLDIHNHERQACLAALDMVGGVSNLNREQSLNLRIGIGLNSGLACVGNLGSIQRFSYSAIGDSVNVASRTENLTKYYGVTIIVTEKTRVAADGLAFLEMDTVRVAGRAAPLVLYTLIGDETLVADEAFRRHAADHAAFWTLYRAGDANGAMAALDRACAYGHSELKRLYDIYRDRIDDNIAQARAGEWNDVFEAQSLKAG